MNKEGRKLIDRLFNQIEVAKAVIAALDIEHVKGVIESVRDEIETLKGEEEEKYEAMPEGFQNGDRGEAMQAAITALETAHDALGEVIDLIESFDPSDKLDEATSALDDAKQ